MSLLTHFVNLPFEGHVLIGSLIRIVLIFYGDYHDNNYDVPYTDIDYKVFTDAARHVVQRDSPYVRHTYRYSPIIAFLLTPNVTFYKNFGKFLFALSDIFITICIKSIVSGSLSSSAARNGKPASSLILEKISTCSSLCWLYNPLSIAISTRGNADSLPCFLIVLSILFLQTDLVRNLFGDILSGFFLAASIHLRLYPIAFSFPMYLCLGEYKINRSTHTAAAFRALIPNRRQVTLTVACVAALLLLTCGMYWLYGYEFLFETYIYHLFRKDTRHNFSVMFYYQYLLTDEFVFDFLKNVVQLFQFCILFVLSLTFGSSKETLCFGVFSQAVVMVTYNGVQTSQYFVWFLSLLPTVAHDLQIKPGKAVLLATMWGLAQGGWLFYAYLLEFKSREVFLLIWLMGVVFFCTNIYILSQLINGYKPGFRFSRASSNIEGERKNI